jgi:excisionase family DNA binding protein
MRPELAMGNDTKIPCRYFAGISWPFSVCAPGAALKRLLTISEAASLLGVRPQTLYLWVSAQRIPHRKIGRLVRFTEEDLEEFVNQQKQPPTSPANGPLPTR